MKISQRIKILMMCQIVCLTFFGVHASADEVTFDDKVKTIFQNEIWTEDIPNLTAEVAYQCTNTEKDATAYLSLYDADGRLIDVVAKKAHISPNSVETVTVQAENTTAAKKAKLLVFDNNLKPLKSSKELSKTENANLIYVDSQLGDDNSDGTYTQPLKTIEKANAAAKELLSSAEKDIYVILKPGTYSVYDTIALGSKNCSEDVMITYTALERGTATLSGGVEVTGFSICDPEQNIYKAKVDASVQSRQLYVNGVRATRARSEGGLADATHISTGITTTDKSLLEYAHIEDLELVFVNGWKMPRCQVAKITDNGLKVTLTMDQPGWGYMESVAKTPAYYENALELLDSEGEFYYDTHEGYVYYKPRFFEDMSTAQIIMPVTENLIEMKGTASNPVKNIQFKGIEFAYTTWNQPSSSEGLAVIQNNMVTASVGGGPILAAVEVKNANRINFYNCKFVHLGGSGLKYSGTAQNSEIIGNEFCDISANGLYLGGVDNTDRAPIDEAHAVSHMTVSNNYLHRIAVDYCSGTAISAGFPQYTDICNNEIFDIPYTGIHIGWGWQDTSYTATKDLNISGNYIHYILNGLLYEGCCDII